MDAFSRLAGATVCAFVALSVWSIGSRSPARLVKDAVTGFRHPLSLARGVARFLVGSVFALLALLLTRGAVVHSAADLFTAFAIGIFIAALSLEALLGPTLRRLCGIGSTDITEDRGSMR